MGYEIEKKFLIKELPENLDTYENKVIEQGYLNKKPVVRVRRSDDTYYMTYKGEGLMKREEYNLPLNKEAYENLVKKCDGNIIKKTRYIIPLGENALINNELGENALINNETGEKTLINGEPGELCIELDVFAYPKGLIMAEVEFPNDAAAESFVPPEWFGEEVTENPKYHNVNMI